MLAIQLEDALQSEVERRAAERQVSVDEFVNEAIRRYLYDLQGEKIKLEQAAFEAMHPRLKESHFGQWVAVHDGQVVDSDEDDVALYHRVRAQYGDEAVLITPVRESPVREFRIRSPRLVRLLS